MSVVTLHRYPGFVANRLQGRTYSVDPEATYEDYREGILDSPEFLAALACANPQLYRSLKDNAAHAMEGKALDRYIHRYLFRSTPTGLLGFVDNRSKSQPNFSINIRTSTARRMRDRDNGSESLLSLNPTLYIIGDEVRLTATCVDASSASESLLVLDASELLRFVINEFDQNVFYLAYNNLKSAVMQMAQVSDASASGYLDELIERDVVRKASAFGVYAGEIDQAAQSSDIQKELESSGELIVCSVPSPDEVESTVSTLEATGAGLGPRRQINIVASVMSPKIIDPGTSVEDASRLLSALGRRNRPLAGFAKAVDAKFGDAWIPLLLALDDEYGYPELAQMVGDRILADVVTNSAYSKILSRVECSGQTSEIGIDDIINDAVAQRRSPPGISITGLLDRITPNSGRAKYAAKYLCDSGLLRAFARLLITGDERIDHLRDKVREWKNNCAQDVIIADVVTFGDPNSFDIVVRQRITDDVVVISGDGYADNYRRVRPVDLEISVQSGQIYVRCIHTGSMVIPIVTSAYNSQADANAVYRFFSALEYNESIVISDSWLRELTARPYLPALRYRSLLVSPEQWRIDASFTPGRIDAELCRIRDQYECRYVQAGIADRILTCDLRSTRSRGVLKSEIIRRKLKWVWRAPQQAPFDQAVVEREMCFSRFGNLTHRSFRGLPALKSAEHDVDGWLYFQFRCKELHVGTFMCDRLIPLVNKLCEAFKIIDWHYLIFPNPFCHIRLRFRLDSTGHADVRKLVREALRAAGTVTDLYAWEEHPYRQEVARYGAQLTEVHKQWTADSEHALRLWADNPSTDMAAAIERIVRHCDRWSAIVGSESIVGETLHRMSRSYDEEFRGASRLAEARACALPDLTAFDRHTSSSDTLIGLEDVSLLPHLIHISAARACVRDLRRTEWLTYGALWRRYALQGGLK
ncbi:TPA: thiopeptide-type bacteriocin biosynthesis protein [Stenotrophomonas maltophilia]